VLLLLLVVLTSAMSVAASFDCSRAASLSAMAVDNDPELSRLDDELGAR